MPANRNFAACQGEPGVMKSWGCTFQFHGGLRCCFAARERRNRPGARLASLSPRVWYNLAWILALCLYSYS